MVATEADESLSGFLAIRKLRDTPDPCITSGQYGGHGRNSGHGSTRNVCQGTTGNRQVQAVPVPGKSKQMPVQSAVCFMQHYRYCGFAAATACESECGPDLRWTKSGGRYEIGNHSDRAR